MSSPDAGWTPFDEALASVDPAIAAELRELARDSSFVDPRVVSHLRD